MAQKGGGGMHGQGVIFLFDFVFLTIVLAAPPSGFI
jgi:hypothetical protein